MTRDDLQLALYLGTSGKTISLAERAALPPDERAALQVWYDQIAIRVILDGAERLANQRSMGTLEDVVPQLEPARQRLLAGKPALIRNGGMDGEGAALLLLEPDGEQVRVSLIVVLDDSVAYIHPSAYEEEVGPLYDYVADHRAEVIKAGEITQLTEAPMDREALLTALEREQQLGEALLREITSNN